MLVEHLAMYDPFGSLFQCVPPDDEIGNKKNEQQLPCGEVAAFFNNYSACQQNSGDDYHGQLFLGVFLVVVFVVVFVVVMVFVLVFVVAMVALFV